MNIAELVEAIARMDEDQRERFVSTLVFKWPELADSLMAQTLLLQIGRAHV